MADLFIHAGYPKTATTTFQTHLFARHREIDYLGKLYPAMTYRDPALAEEINQLVNADETRYEGGHRLREIAERYRQASDRKSLVLSSESFLHVQGNDQGLIARRLHAACSPCKVLITLRSQLDILKSWYANHGRFGQYLFVCKSESEKFRLPLSLDEWLKFSFRVPEMNFTSKIHYYDVVRYYARVFGRENVGLFLFEEFAQNRAEYVKRLCSFLGIDAADGLALVLDKHENPRFTRREMLYYHLVGRYLPAGSFDYSRRRIPRLLARFLARSAPAEVRLGPDWEQRLRALYSGGNNALASEFGLPLAQYGYPL